MRILIAEEDRALGLFLKQGLELDGHDVEWLPDAAGVAAAFVAGQHDLVVLDLLAGGLQALRQIRSASEGVPMLVLTARPGVEERVSCLDAGADDCMLKPLSLHELRARCRALLRRRRDGKLVLRCAGVELNRVSHAVVCDGRPVSLTNKEFALLEYLMLHSGSCVSRASLLAQVWNQVPQTNPASDTNQPDRTSDTNYASDSNYASDTNVVDVYINYLRRKLRESASMIRTVRGKGYYLGVLVPPEISPGSMLSTLGVEA